MKSYCRTIIETGTSERNDYNSLKSMGITDHLVQDMTYNSQTFRLKKLADT